MRKKILFVITRAERGGAQAHVQQLLASTRSHYDVALASGEEGYLLDQARILKIPVFLLPNLSAPLNPLRDICAFAELSRVIRAFQPDLIHAHSSKAGFFARIAARFQGIPSVFTAHGWAFSDGVSLTRKWIALSAERLAGQLGESIITVSQFDRELAVRNRIGKPKYLTTIRNGISDDPGRASPEAGCTPVITMVARFSPQKDQLTLLRAISRVTTPFVLQFAGDGPLLETARDTAERLGICNRTKFLGNCEDVTRLLLESHVFALISRYEGLPISILEAMRAGLPILASDVGGVSEAVRHNWNGLLVGRGDEDALSGALEFLLSKNELRARFGRNSREAFENLFTDADMIEQTFEVYEQTLARSGNRGRVETLTTATT